MRPTAFFLLLFMVLAGCGSRHTFLPPDGGDAGPDADLRDAEVAPDGPLQCGDERGLVDVPPQPIVHGESSFDPAVVDLSEGQVLAVGALTMNYGGGWWVGICTGTIVSPTVALTASHCVLDDSGRLARPSEVRFAVGEDSEYPIYSFGVAEVLSHADYEPHLSEPDHDFAILVLTEATTDVLPELEPIPVACDDFSMGAFGRAVVQVVGYGMTDPDEHWPMNTRRWWATERVGSINPRAFTVEGDGTTGVCFGDSGGPTLWTMPDGVVRVMGVLSLGEQTCVDTAYYSLARDNCELLDSVVGGCGDVTTSGYCNGDRAVYCDGEELTVTDCAEAGMTCGEDDSGAMRCVGVPDPCRGETERGRCDDDDTVIYCVDGEIVELSCLGQHESCGLDDLGLYRCVEDPCRGLDWVGACYGSTAQWCDDGELRQRSCRDCGQRCGWSQEYRAIYCID